MALRIGRMAVVLALVACAQVASGAHWPGGGLGKHQGKFWKREKVRKKLQLSAEEVRRLEDIFTRHQPTLAELESDVKRKKADFEELLADEHVEDGRILAEVDALERVRARLGKERVTMLLEMRRVLTPEQRHKLAELDDDD